ncbi:AbrB/MazE/SpoVT family DNA-binding domain-containing protein [Pararhizobium sp. PWRC1-1]|uniref:AbrB/MazE/SpoVT family DNA-binding domain-containing protein n=1 Tax=Pararhizobium sp. PWRC1-1 TaxID=2804566 RepID=UPI003CEC6685
MDIIPKPLLPEFGVEAGDSVELKVEATRIVIERVINPLRQAGPRMPRNWLRPGTISPSGLNLATKTMLP